MVAADHKAITARAHVSSSQSPSRRLPVQFPWLAIAVGIATAEKRKTPRLTHRALAACSTKKLIAVLISIQIDSKVA